MLYFVSQERNFELRLTRVLNRLDFKITKDEGHFNHWKYSVEYEERLSHWPVTHVAEADFVVRKLDAGEQGDYIVSSEHRTCFAAGLYCRKWNEVHASTLDKTVSYFFAFLQFIRRESFASLAWVRTLIAWKALDTNVHRSWVGFADERWNFSDGPSCTI